MTDPLQQAPAFFSETVLSVFTDIPLSLAFFSTRDAGPVTKGVSSGEAFPAGIGKRFPPRL